MTIRQIIVEIHRHLSGQYPETEIESFVRILCRYYLDMTPAQVHLSQDYELPAEVGKEILKAIEELKNNRPVQYILGETEFYGLHLKLTSDVLIPRPETEELVDWIVHEYDRNAPLTMADVGTGSGCIAVALAANFPNANIWAVDISGAALDIARQNAAKNKVKVHFLLKDVLKDAPMGFEPASLDVIVSNPPYVTPSEKDRMQPCITEYEPHEALFTPENDPLVFYRQIAAFGKQSLKNRGKIFFEINETFSREVMDVLKHHGYSSLTPRKDIHAKWRMVSGMLCH